MFNFVHTKDVYKLQFQDEWENDYVFVCIITLIKSIIGADKDLNYPSLTHFQNAASKRSSFHQTLVWCKQITKHGIIGERSVRFQDIDEREVKEECISHKEETVEMIQQHVSIIS